MRVDKKLNIVIPVTRDDGSKIFVHSIPISMSVFETYFLPLSTANNVLWRNKISFFSGPRVAAMALKSAAIETDCWGGDAGVANGLIGEIKRLSNVISPSHSGGWQTTPLDTALRGDTFSEEEWSAVENILVFFTLASRLFQKNEGLAILTGMSGYYKTSLTPLTPMEYAHSLQTYKTEESSGEMVMEASTTETNSSAPSTLAY